MKGKKDNTSEQAPLLLPQKGSAHSETPQTLTPSFFTDSQEDIESQASSLAPGPSQAQLFEITQPRRNHEELSMLHGLELCPCPCFGLAQAWLCQLLQQIGFSSLMTTFMSFNFFFFSLSVIGNVCKKCKNVRNYQEAREKSLYL